MRFMAFFVLALIAEAVYFWKFTTAIPGIPGTDGRFTGVENT
jgi:hypothetical protein